MPVVVPAPTPTEGDVNTLLAASKCFIEPCCSQAEREAIQILIRLRDAIGLGGIDLTDPTTLQQAVSGFNRMSEIERQSIDVYFDLQKAIGDGATFPGGTTANELKVAARCYLCIPKAIRKNILLALKGELILLDLPLD